MIENKVHARTGRGASRIWTIVLVLLAGLAPARTYGEAGPQAQSLWPNAAEARRLVLGETLLVKGDDGWRLMRPFEAKADDEKVRKFLARLEGARVERISDAASAVRFPQSGPRLEGSRDARGDRAELDIVALGSGPDFGSVIFRRADGGLLAARGLWSFELEVKPEQWLDSSVAKIEPASIESLELRHAGRRVSLARSGHGWKLAGSTVPVRMDVDWDRIEPALSRLANLWAEGVMPPTDDSSAAASHLPYADLSIAVVYGGRDRDGKPTQRRIEFTASAPGADWSCVMRRSDSALGYVVSSWQLDEFRRLADELGSDDPIEEHRVDAEDHSAVGDVPALNRAESGRRGS